MSRLGVLRNRPLLIGALADRFSATGTQCVVIDMNLRARVLITATDINATFTALPPGQFQHLRVFIIHKLLQLICWVAHRCDQTTRLATWLTTWPCVEHHRLELRIDCSRRAVRFEEHSILTAKLH